MKGDWEKVRAGREGRGHMPHAGSTNAIPHICNIFMNGKVQICLCGSCKHITLSFCKNSL